MKGLFKASVVRILGKVLIATGAILVTVTAASVVPRLRGKKLKGPSKTTVMRIMGNVLIAAGAAILITVTAVYGYGEYQRYVFEREQPKFSDVIPGSISEENPEDSLAENVEVTPQILESQLTPTPSPTPTPIPLRNLPPVWIRVQKIGVDSQVVPSKIYNDEWLVPRFVVGHLDGTSNPGRNGNVVMSGHIESIGAGNIFEKLDDLQVGDEAVVYTAENIFYYRVSEKKTVPNSDTSVAFPTEQPILTLITCTGTWNSLTRDYSHRLIIIASLVRVSAIPILKNAE